MKVLPKELKSELLMFVLERTSIQEFNACTKTFSVQRLYSACRMELMAAYPELMPGRLPYSIVMAEVFRPFKADEIACPELLRRIDGIKRLLPTYKRMNVEKWAQKVLEHDALVVEYMEKLRPQNELIKLYKNIIKVRVKSSTVIDAGNKMPGVAHRAE